jgi:hypothetical protein
MTLAQARRQIWTRRLVGGVLVVLAMLFLFLTVVKAFYHSPVVGPHLPRPIKPISGDWAVLSWLWSLIPTWSLPSATAATPAWDYLYIAWGAMVVIGIGGFLLRSARDRHAQIRQMYQEVEREQWSRELFGPIEQPQELQREVIQQLPAPAEPWQRKPYGIVILGLVVLLVGNLLLLVIKPWLFPNAR